MVKIVFQVWASFTVITLLGALFSNAIFGSTENMPRWLVYVLGLIAAGFIVTTPLLFLTIVWTA